MSEKRETVVRFIRHAEVQRIWSEGKERVRFPIRSNANSVCIVCVSVQCCFLVYVFCVSVSAELLTRSEHSVSVCMCLLSVVLRPSLRPHFPPH